MKSFFSWAVAGSAKATKTANDKSLRIFFIFALGLIIAAKLGKLCISLPSEQKDMVMTAVQLKAMNVQFWHDMGVIAEDEGMMKRVAKYVRKLAKEMTEDPTLMTKEEYFAKIERAEQQSARGEGLVKLPGEDLTTFLRRNGYDI